LLSSLNQVDLARRTVRERRHRFTWTQPSEPRTSSTCHRR